jgi:2-polyprenyl-3-methyl-5-hydroxy-6-metoxy-1,4-benzoquinol methylase
MSLLPDASLAASLSPVQPLTACKICGEPTRLYGVVDFNKNCEANRGRFFPLAGVPVWYHRCTNCRFLFTGQFDHWTADMFRRHIYNADYIRFDPDAQGDRARGNAARLIKMARRRNAKRLLDYGGGNGTVARILTEHGFDAVSWDPLLNDQPQPPAGSFDLVSAYEVLEHSATPLLTCRQALSFLRDGGVFVFSTLTLDALRPQTCDNWYIAPRNGHISIHTSKSLELLFARLDRKVHHFDAALHLAHPIAGNSGIPGDTGSG